MEGALWLITAKFYSAVIIFYLLGPELLRAFNEFKAAGQLRSQIHWLTGGFVLMLFLAGLAFNGPPIQ